MCMQVFVLIASLGCLSNVIADQKASASLWQDEGSMDYDYDAKSEGDAIIPLRSESDFSRALQSLIGGEGEGEGEGEAEADAVETPSPPTPVLPEQVPLTPAPPTPLPTVYTAPTSAPPTPAPPTDIVSTPAPPKEISDMIDDREGEGEGDEGATSVAPTPLPTSASSGVKNEGTCYGNDSRCDTSSQATCIRLFKQGADCTWNSAALNSGDSAGICFGMDSRCSGSDEQVCNTLQAQRADCRWRAAFRVAGSLVMSGANMDAFVANPSAKQVVREGLSSVTGVPSSYIDVDLIVESRRLRARQLSQGSRLLVTYVIVVGGDAPETIQVTGTEVGEKLQASISLQNAITRSIETNLGGQFEISIESIDVPDVFESGSPSTSVSMASSSTISTTSSPAASSSSSSSFLSPSSTSSTTSSMASWDKLYQEEELESGATGLFNSCTHYIMVVVVLALLN